MALETGNFIDLNAANPVSTDGLAQADDHLRLIKSTIKATFPEYLWRSDRNAHNELRRTASRTFRRTPTIDPQRNQGCSSSRQQPQQAGPSRTSNNNKALRVVSGTASTGGSVGFHCCFRKSHPDRIRSARQYQGTVANHTLTSVKFIAQSRDDFHARASRFKWAGTRATIMELAPSSSPQTVSAEEEHLITAGQISDIHLHRFCD